ncbi:hypothetical protein DRN73_05435, partial [Candidatus Pacearchaeota archaeon]
YEYPNFILKDNINTPQKIGKIKKIFEYKNQLVVSDNNNQIWKIEIEKRKWKKWKKLKSLNFSELKKIFKEINFLGKKYKNILKRCEIFSFDNHFFLYDTIKHKIYKICIKHKKLKPLKVTLLKPKGIKHIVKFGGKILFLRNDTVKFSLIQDTTFQIFLKEDLFPAPSLSYTKNKKLIAITFDGKIYRFENGKFKFENKLPISGFARIFNDTIKIWNLKDSAYLYSYPDLKFWGVETGKDIDLWKYGKVKGSKDGKIYYDTLLIADIGDWAIPVCFDIDNDGEKEIIASNAEGNLFIFKRKGAEFTEYFSWKPFENLYPRYCGEKTLFVFSKRLKNFADSLITASLPYYRDEIKFCLKNLSSEVLWRMYEKGELGEILTENARLIYSMSKKLKYAKLIELPDNRTTLLLNGKDTIPPDIYYWYVVFPRILYEVPEKPFWRNYFYHDKTYGKKLLDVVKNAKTVKEAIEKIHEWMKGKGEIKGFMEFGYETQDLQPVEIYKKAYGSCGEYSILACAFARTALIPSYVVIDMGEDHQWNEFFDGKRWIHWDATFPFEKAIDTPRASIMGKKIAAIVSWRPDGKFFNLTPKYSDTCRINLKVIDKNGNPIPGAMVIVRSGWNDRFLVGLIGYTNTKGEFSYNAGLQNEMIEVYYPNRRAGISRLYVRKNKTKNITLTLPINLPHFDKYYNFEGYAYLDILNFRTREKYKEYIGKIKIPVVNGILYNPYPHILIKIPIIKKDSALSEKPSLHARLLEDTIPMGNPVKIYVKSKDNLSVKNLNFLIKDNQDKVKGKKIIRKIGKKFIEDTFEIYFDKLFPKPGKYTIYIEVEDYGGNKDKEKLRFYVKENFVFKNQPIKQERIDTVIGSWSYEFSVKDALPFLIIQTSSKDRIDIDLYLFKDGKKFKQSTSPTSREKIYVSPLLPGKYRIAVQGWNVPKGESKFDIKIYPLIKKE